MPWTPNYFPIAMKYLNVDVREKAIDIGNALMDEDMEEGIAIATAISRAKDWAANKGLPTNNHKSSRSTDVKKHGRDKYIIPYKGNKWALKEEGNEKVDEVFENKDEAVKEGRKKAKDVNGTLTIQKRTGTIQHRISYNSHKRVRI
jgi:uncharacterized protein YdaT